MADQRLKSVYDAGSFLFIKQGYANTQVSQIAEKAHMATGTIYNLFSGKKSVLHFILLCTFDKQFLEGDIELPVKEVDTKRLIAHLSEIVEGLFSKIEQRAEDGTPAQSFIEMLGVLFDYGADYQVAFNLINNNQAAVPELEKEYRQFVNHLYEVIRGSLYHYIERGEVRQIDLPEMHIRNIIEGITWWSMYLPYQAPSMDVPVHKAKEIALDILSHAYLTKPSLDNN